MQTETIRPSSRKAEEMRYLLVQQQSSGQTIKEFCKEQHLSVAMFYYWQKKLRQPVNTVLDTGGFEELFEMSTAPVGGQLFAEYRGIRFYQEPSAAFLRQLIGQQC